MIPKPLEAVEASDLLNLVSVGAEEGRAIEFKRGLPGSSDADVREFLADVTSLANASGGDLIFGIACVSGRATSLEDLGGTADDHILRLESIIQSCVSPRIGGVRSQAISSEAGLQIVVRIPASFAAPHRVTHKGSGRFFTRNSRGKYEMDVDELRHAFLASADLPARLRALHADAVGKVDAGSLGTRLDSGAKVILSIVPINHGREKIDADLTLESVAWPPLAGNSLQERVCLEGLAVEEISENRVQSQALTHRSGRVDIIWIAGRIREDERRFWAISFEERLSRSIKNTIPKMKAFGIDGPWAVFITLRHVCGYHLVTHVQWERSMPATEDTFQLPDFIVEEPDDASLIRMLKLVWEAFGLRRPMGAPIGLKT